MRISFEFSTKHEHLNHQEIWCETLTIVNNKVGMTSVSYTESLSLINLLQLKGVTVECTKGNVDLFQTKWTIRIPTFIIHNMDVKC